MFIWGVALLELDSHTKKDQTHAPYTSPKTHPLKNVKIKQHQSKFIFTYSVIDIDRQIDIRIRDLK